ncbi:metal ABC transporter permease [Synechococcus sp. M16CYN]|uniref:metal ABC transporter permease n=1 Tax=Synechococcus sp. M16CYN TaxID=3103139 RepID=UPI003253CA4C
MNELEIWWFSPLILALLVGIICPATGVLLITQRRILLANLMAHSVLPGLVLALAFELDPTIGGLISGLLGALLAERLNQSFKGREEVSMNTVLAGFTALGVLLVPLMKARVDLETILFGDLLTANSSDLIRTLIATVALALLFIIRYKDLVFIGVDPEGAGLAKRPVMQIRFITIFITALVIISAITAVGIVLVIALLCAPVLIHLDKSTSLVELIVRSSMTGLALTSGGMMLAVTVDLPPGPLIGTLCVVLLIIEKVSESIYA